MIAKNCIFCKDSMVYTSVFEPCDDYVGNQFANWSAICYCDSCDMTVSLGLRYETDQEALDAVLKIWNKKMLSARILLENLASIASDSDIEVELRCREYHCNTPNDHYIEEYVSDWLRSQADLLKGELNE